MTIIINDVGGVTLSVDVAILYRFAPPPHGRSKSVKYLSYFNTRMWCLGLDSLQEVNLERRWKPECWTKIQYQLCK